MMMMMMMMMKRKRYSFTNTVPVSSDDDEESTTPNDNVCCPTPGVILNDCHLLPALKILRNQFLQIGGLVDPLSLHNDPQEQNLNIKDKNIYLILINNNHWVNNYLRFIYIEKYTYFLFLF